MAASTATIRSNRPGRAASALGLLRSQVAPYGAGVNAVLAEVVEHTLIALADLLGQRALVGAQQRIPPVCFELQIARCIEQRLDEDVRPERVITNAH